MCEDVLAVGMNEQGMNFKIRSSEAFFKTGELLKYNQA